METLQTVSWVGVVLATVSAFVLGGPWYSPALFGKASLNAAKLTWLQ
jgi:hypothetical protein